MSFFFGGGGKKVKPQFTGLAVQTSTSAVAIGLWYGLNRGAGNIIWQGDFKSHKQKQGGKGGGGKGATTYTYSGSYQLGLCWGPITGITRVWKDNSKENDYSKLGFSLQVGTNPQSPWGHLTAKHPAEALGYPDIAVLSVANYDLGPSNAFPQHSFETEALLVGTGIGGTVDDADPALVIEDFLADEVHGVGFDTSILSNLLSTVDAPTTGDSTFQTYCQAMGFAMSPFLSSQEEAGKTIERWADLCNTAIVYTGYSLKFYPYGSEDITANGVTYLADFPIRYSLTDRDFIYDEGQDPIRFNRSDPADAFNSFSIVISNRENEYNDLPVPWRDQGLIDQFGLKNEDTLDAKEITDPVTASIMVTYMGQRKAYIRNSFEFRLGPQYCRLEPMDVLQCYDPRMGTFLVLIKEISETEDDEFEIVAEEYPSSISTNASNATQPTTNDPVDTNVPAGSVNPPVIFEPPASLSGAAQVWVGVSGGDGTTANPNWGGCYVWLSTDNVTFNQIGEIETAARQGKLTSILAAYVAANPDASNTLQLNMGMSAGELEDAASSSDAAAGVTISYIESASGYELMSYEDVTLTGTDLYDVDLLWRSQYGSVNASHASGSDFLRLDDAVFKYDLPQDYIGVPLYLKFQSYNIFGGAVEDISTCTVYNYTPTGVGYGTGSGGLPSTPTGLSGSAGTTYAKLTWNANPVNDGVIAYQVWRAVGSGQPFGSATLQGTVTGAGLEYTDTAVTNQAYTYFLVAVNSVGSSTNTAGINLTPTIAAIPFGFAFNRDTSSANINRPICAFDTPIAWTMPTGLPDCQGSIVDGPISLAVAPSAQTDFDIQVAGVSVGTMRFAASSLTATFIKGSSTAVALGATTTIVAPADLNGIAGIICGSIKGTR